MFELNLVPHRPSGEDGLLCDEAVAAAFCALMGLIHLALVDSVLLVVMVRDSSVIGSTVAER